MPLNFDATTTEFSQANAYACAVQSALAYDRPASWQVGNEKGITRWIETELAHICISETTSAVFVAFRGTKSPRDFITDAEFLRQRSAYFGGAIHGGILKAFLSISDQLTDALFKLPPKPLFVTGHSLGGALAQLCAVACQKLNIPVRAVYTFGQPRVGDADWARAYGPRLKFDPMGSTLGARTFRVVNEEDIVPRIPWLGYKHAGQVAFLSCTGSARASRAQSGAPAGLSLNPPIWKIAWSDLIGLWRAYRAAHSPLGALDELLADHHIDKYIARLSS